MGSRLWVVGYGSNLKSKTHGLKPLRLTEKLLQARYLAGDQVSAIDETPIILIIFSDREELLADWDLAVNGQTPFPIEPLR